MNDVKALSIMANGNDGDGGNITPEDVSDEQADWILTFLNGATTPEEIADVFPEGRDGVLNVTRNIFEERESRNGFDNINEVAEVPQLDSDRFEELVGILGEELVPTPSEREYLQEIPPKQQISLMKLQRYEDTVLERLNDDEELAETFFTDPARALEELRVPVDPALKKRLQAQQQDPPTKRRTFCLPNGQEITPNVNVRLVAHNSDEEVE